ncbi:MAG: anhydro-N-acetylmuramic acid kinase [Thermotogae bacterium]|nr:MAG: anhydro-N-acetylmuramic acid kinase [Thermotogota bacterium]
MDLINELLRIRKKKVRRIIGCMSGTSFDGIDVAIVDIDGVYTNTKYQLLYADTFEYPQTLKELLTRFTNHPRMEDLALLDWWIGKLHVEAICEALEKSGISKESVDLISMHGQTVWHDPKKMSLQIGNADMVSSEIGKLVVCDFRSGDIATGGEGAPLTPYVDYIVFGKGKKTILLNNIGGISNVTVVTDDLHDLIAFDTGPGNVLINLAVKRYFNLEYDPDGEIASKGVVKEEVVHRVLKSDEYIHISPPKSTGREYYNSTFLDRFQVSDPYDLVATVTYYTAYTMYYAYKRFIFSKYDVKYIYLSGGGARNRTLVRYLRNLMPEKRIVRFSDTFSKYKEAIWFAILGNEFINSYPSDLRPITGARKRKILGRLAVP